MTARRVGRLRQRCSALGELAVAIISLAKAEVFGASDIVLSSYMAQNPVRLVESGEHSPIRHPGYGGDKPWYMGVPTLIRNQLFKCVAIKFTR